MLELTDTHCHIQSAGLTRGETTTRELWAKQPDLTGKKLAENARQSGVTRLICVGCDLEDSELAVSFAQSERSCWASIGIHPHEAEHFDSDDAAFTKFASLADKPKVVAVGECGLDYFYTHSPKSNQLAMLEKQLSLAQAYNLPVIFHVREAFDDFWPLFDNFSGIKGVLHSFTDDTANLEKALDRDLYIGVNGIATFAKKTGQQEMYKQIPIGHLLLETDAPFLTPVPHRGSMNEPKQIVTIAEFLANLRNEPLEQIALSTTQNAINLFKV